jgi:ribosomal protein L11 methyltransferase
MECASLPVKRVDITTVKGREEILDPEFYALCGGVWIEEQEGRVLIKCYPSDAAALLAYLDASGWSSGSIAVVDEEEKDYVALMRRQFTPIRVGDVLIIPPWSKAKRKGHTIVIEPAMAFGTGRHESTRLMIRMMGGSDIAGKKVLDIGSGSGILAIYARLLGAVSVLAVDHDPVATEAAQKSFELNDVRDIELACCSVEGITGEFDVVLANLDFATFKAHSREVLRLVTEDGLLIVSGIERQYAAGTPGLFVPATLVNKTRMKDWHGFVFRKGKKR